MRETKPSNLRGPPTSICSTPPKSKIFFFFFQKKRVLFQFHFFTPPTSRVVSLRMLKARSCDGTISPAMHKMCRPMPAAYSLR